MKRTTKTSDGREVPVTHERADASDQPCAEGERYVTVKRTIAIEETVMVDVPEGETPDDYARQIVDGAEHWEMGDEWVRDGATEPGQIVGYHTEVGNY